MTDIERLEDIKNALEEQCMLAVKSTSVIEDRLDIEKIYRSQIQTFENAISAFKKQIPKKPIKIDETYVVERDEWVVDYECPSCGNPYADDSFCSCCGQALDWSDTE